MTIMTSLRRPAWRLAAALIASAFVSHTAFAETSTLRVAQERNGLYGGLFVDRISAMSYALFENSHHPEAIIPVPSVLELKISARPNAASSIVSASHVTSKVMPKTMVSRVE